nr:SDR family oxidoreductase [uncultured Pedobacter sp.]
MKKVALITGTSTGLGLETSIALAKAGYKVYATMRNLEKKEVLKSRADDGSLSVEILELDVSKEESIKGCIENIIAIEGKIDVLVNNAGAGFLKPSEQTSDKELQQITDVNYFGTVRCTNAVLPYMRNAKSGHIVNISSVGGLVGQPFNEIYCAAKFAVEGYTEALATYITPFFNVKFTLVEPGGIATEFANSVFKGLEKSGGITGDYQPILDKYVASMQNRPKADLERIYQTGEQVAKTIAEVIENENPPLRIRTSDWANEFTSLKTKADPNGLTLHNALVEAYFK